MSILVRSIIYFSIIAALVAGAVNAEKIGKYICDELNTDLCESRQVTSSPYETRVDYSYLYKQAGKGKR